MSILDNPRLKEPLLGRWMVDEFIGAGQYGKVYKVHDSNGREAAIKIISMPNESIRQACEAQYGSDDELEEFITELVQKFTAEVESMKKLREESRNIIEIIDNRALQKGYYWDVLIVMEHAAPLKDYISSNSITIDQAIRLMRDIASALAVCEKNNIIHRDIKDDNIFVGRDGLFKIGDFGVANMEANQEFHTQGIGTPNYMAPEVKIGLEYDTRADIYSLGIVLYRIFNGGRLPFVDAKTRGTEANKMRMAGHKLPPPENAQRNIAEIILKCCEYKPENRYSHAEELIRDLDALRSEMNSYELAQEIPLRKRRKTDKKSFEEQAGGDEPKGPSIKNRRNEKVPDMHNSDNDETVPTWKTYDPAVESKRSESKAIDDPDDITHGIDMTMEMTGNRSASPYPSGGQAPENSTTDIIRAYIDKHSSNSPILKKLMEKNKLLENEKQQLLRSKRSNKMKKIIIGGLAAAVVIALACILLVIIFSTAYFANESDYHRIYSRSIVSGEQLFDSSQAAYLSENEGYLYFSEVSYTADIPSTYAMYRINIKSKEKELICSDPCHFDVVIDDYVYFTCGPKGSEYLYRIRKDGKNKDGGPAEKEMLLEASCYDLQANGKTLSFKVLDMNGQERTVNTTKIGNE